MVGVSGLTNNCLEGMIPTELGFLTSVYSLDLENNRLSGTIPSEMALLASLTEL
eukprot:gene916-1431_t